LRDSCTSLPYPPGREIRIGKFLYLFFHLLQLLLLFFFYLVFFLTGN